MINLADATWRKSSFSGGGGGNCIEVADGYADVMPVRDSKVPDGPALVLPIGAWSAFVNSVKGGAL